MTVLFVEYPKCSTCKKAKAWLDEHGVEYIDRDIVTDNPAADELAVAAAESASRFECSGWDVFSIGRLARLNPRAVPIRADRRSLRACRACRSNTLRP